MGVFLGSLKFQIFFGVFEIPDIFGGWTVDAGPEPTYEEKNESIPPTHTHLGLYYAFSVSF